MRWTREAWARFDALMQRPGMTRPLAAELLRVTTNAIKVAERKRAVRLGLACRKSGPPRREFSAAEDALIRRRRDEGFGWKSIGRELRISDHTAERHGVKDLGLPKVINKAQQAVSLCQSYAARAPLPPGDSLTWGMLEELVSPENRAPYAYQAPYTRRKAA